MESSRKGDSTTLRSRIKGGEGEHAGSLDGVKVGEVMGSLDIKICAFLSRVLLALTLAFKSMR